MFQKQTFGTTNTGFGSFNAGASTSSPFSGFKPTTGTSAFGAPPAFGANATPQPTTGGGLFGATNTSNSLFGGNTTTSSFGTSGGFGFGGATTSGGLFNKPTTSGLFGNNQNNSSFGAKPTDFAFGSTANTNTTGLFGSAPSTSTGLFGQQNTTLGGGGLFGNTSGCFVTQQATVTAHVKYNPVVGTDVVVKSGSSQNVNVKHHCVTCMKEYENKSLEELRLEDYTAGRKGAQGGGMFGGFQQTENKPLFGASTFGQPATTSAPSLFGTGIGSTPAFGQINTFSFRNATQANTNTTGLFGANKPAFGAPSTGTGLFGATTTQAPAFGTNTPTFGFGTNTQNQSSAGLFGAKPATSGFGTPASLRRRRKIQPRTFGGFGAAPGGLFGAKPQQTTAPTFDSSAPTFGSTAPTFGSTAPTLGSTAPTFGSTAPTFGSTAPTFGSTAPTFGSTAPTFGSTAPTFGSTAPTFGSTAPTFGSTAPGGFVTQQATGTAYVKYNSVLDIDETIISGSSQKVNVTKHCITCMKEYESKSLEELRLEDYAAGRKGVQWWGVFGCFPETENKPLLGAPNSEDAGLAARLAELEAKCSRQDDELLCLRSTLADVLRRLNAPEERAPATTSTERTTETRELTIRQPSDRESVECTSSNGSGPQRQLTGSLQPDSPAPSSSAPTSSTSPSNSEPSLSVPNPCAPTSSTSSSTSEPSLSVPTPSAPAPSATTCSAPSHSATTPSTRATATPLTPHPVHPHRSRNSSSGNQSPSPGTNDLTKRWKSTGDINTQGSLPRTSLCAPRSAATRRT